MRSVGVVGIRHFVRDMANPPMHGLARAVDVQGCIAQSARRVVAAVVAALTGWICCIDDVLSILGSGLQTSSAQMN